MDPWRFVESGDKWSTWSKRQLMAIKYADLEA